MNITIDNFFKSLLVSSFFLLITACVTSTPVEPLTEPVSFLDSAEPLVQARFGEVLVGPFNREVMKNENLRSWGRHEDAYKDLKKSPWY